MHTLNGITCLDHLNRDPYPLELGDEARTLLVVAHVPVRDLGQVLTRPPTLAHPSDRLLETDLQPQNGAPWPWKLGERANLVSGTREAIQDEAAGGAH